MADDRPNILLLLTDQQRFDTIRALGNPVIRTPVLDDLVARGTAFTRAYTPSPVCVSARGAMLTGLEPQTTGCTDNAPMDFSRQSLMQRLP
ncbi:MAG TPA: sulfatase, partial [Armatimonadetes bacterium]|nr:sulfatase [Armatimonadota bacterium]